MSPQQGGLVCVTEYASRGDGGGGGGGGGIIVGVIPYRVRPCLENKQLIVRTSTPLPIYVRTCILYRNVGNLQSMCFYLFTD